jgi:hypothetical protein
VTPILKNKLTLWRDNLLHNTGISEESPPFSEGVANVRTNNFARFQPPAILSNQRSIFKIKKNVEPKKKIMRPTALA